MGFELGREKRKKGKKESKKNGLTQPTTHKPDILYQNAIWFIYESTISPLYLVFQSSRGL